MKYWIVTLRALIRGEEFEANIRVEADVARTFLSVGVEAAKVAGLDKTVWAEVDDWGANGCYIDEVFPDFNTEIEIINIQPRATVTLHNTETVEITLPGI